MDFARAIIAAVLATGLVIIVVIQEVGDADEVQSDVSLDPTFLLLMGAIVILTVPDAISYFRKKKGGKKEDDD